MAAFTIIALASGTEQAQRLDLEMVSWANRDATESSQQAWRATSELGNVLVAVAVLLTGAVASLAIRAPRRALVLAGTAIMAPLATSMLKAAFDRARPDGASIGTGSFPSGHTALATLAFGLLALLVVDALVKQHTWPPWAKRVAIIAWLSIALAVGVARLMGGAHWASDVLGGWAWGATFLAFALWVESRGRRQPKTAAHS